MLPGEELLERRAIDVAHRLRACDRKYNKEHRLADVLMTSPTAACGCNSMASRFQMTSRCSSLQTNQLEAAITKSFGA
jgi:hypothetical protein